ncbi:hypothetical protein GCK72_024372 [Caenorhabditis remanei]|uniref:Uncharacterized protein n=1 Tax=Caenorhabditis remanei TaxID=31234 RepID=A0A6A5FZ22_CAERE|nr:hypothetical protein GCK72_024372 [Caenorhabditis remanei]KAF1747906.1 hypothetical protein GCK72_024372 [Caenorhabditis remanei]
MCWQILCCAKTLSQFWKRGTVDPKKVVRNFVYDTAKNGKKGHKIRVEIDQDAETRAEGDEVDASRVGGDQDAPICVKEEKIFTICDKVNQDAEMPIQEEESMN